MTISDRDRYPPTAGDRIFGWVLIVGALTMVFGFTALFVWSVASIIGVI